MIGLIMAATAAASTPASPRTGTVSSAIHSEVLKRTVGGLTQSFRVDYTASLQWSLADKKVCLWGHCHATCDVVITSRVLSRKLWWLPSDGAPVLAEDAPNQREYSGGATPYGGACTGVSDADIARAASDRLRPHQFAEELIQDRELVGLAADSYLARYPARTPSR